MGPGENHFKSDGPELPFSIFGAATWNSVRRVTQSDLSGRLAAASGPLRAGTAGVIRRRQQRFDLAPMPGNEALLRGLKAVDFDGLKPDCGRSHPRPQSPRLSAGVVLDYCEQPL